MTHDLASGQTRMAPSHTPERLAATRVWVADPGCGRRAEKARRSWSLRPRGRPVDRSSQLAARTSVPGGNRSRDPSTLSQPHRCAACERCGFGPAFARPRHWAGLVRRARAATRGAERADLGGEQSPWKDRVSSRRKRRRDTTDSSAEQGPEVGRFASSRNLAVTSVHGRAGCGSRSRPSDGSRRRPRAPPSVHAPQRRRGDAPRADGDHPAALGPVADGLARDPGLPVGRCASVKVGVRLRADRSFHRSRWRLAPARLFGGSDATPVTAREATARGDAVSGCRRGKLFVGCEPASRGGRTEVRHRLRTGPAPSCPKRGEPLAGYGAQQTRGPCAEQTVEVVRNHEGGTCPAPGSVGPKGARSLEWTRTGDVGGGARESHERRTRCEAGPTLARALRRGSQGHEGRRSRLRSGRPSVVGTPRGPSRQRRKVEEGAGKANDPLPSRRLGQRSVGFVAASQRP